MVAVYCGKVQALTYNFNYRAGCYPCCNKVIFSLIANTYNPEVINGNSSRQYVQG